MDNRNVFTSMLYGLITILIIIFSTSLIISLLLRFTSLTESSFSWIIIGLTFISLFIGGFVSGGKSRQKGWLVGAGTGVLYTLFVFFIQYLGYNSTFTSQQIFFHIGYILLAIIGGIIGVNIVRNNRMV